MFCPCVGSSVAQRPAVAMWAGRLLLLLLLLLLGLNGTGQAGLSQLEDDWPDWRFRNVCDPALLHIHSPSYRSATVLAAPLSFLGFLSIGSFFISVSLW